MIRLFYIKIFQIILVLVFCSFYSLGIYAISTMGESQNVQDTLQTTERNGKSSYLASNISILGSDNERSYSMYGGTLTVQGFGNKISVSGYAERIDIQGSENSLNIDAIDFVKIEGSDNAVRYVHSKRKSDNISTSALGSDNSVNKR